jgi:propanol-preferring alcohol dehydrogenase
MPVAARAMLLEAPGTPLVEGAIDLRDPSRSQILVRVLACGVCRTDLHVVDGELQNPKLPLVPGHEIVGIVEGCGPDAHRFKPGDRIGVPWLAATCGGCEYCRSDRENLCDAPLLTGYTVDGGYATHALADERYCVTIPAAYTDLEAAPLLCAGLIGYRSLKKAGDGERLGIYGFGAAAHIVAQVARWQGRSVFAFTRPGDTVARSFAVDLGAAWAGGSDEMPPEPLDAAIIFAPVGSLIPTALAAVHKGGIVVCGGIHMSNITSFPYDLLWGERTVTSVANLTRRDAQEFLDLAPRVPVHTRVTPYPLYAANAALADFRTGRLTCAAVLVPDTVRG